MAKKGLFVLVLAVIAVGGVFAQSYTCTMVASGSGYEVWRDDENGQTWIEWRGMHYVFYVVGKVVQGTYEVVCSNGVRGTVGSAEAIAVIAKVSLPAAGALAVYRAICYLGDQAFR
jgi:hypothetical protein